PHGGVRGGRGGVTTTTPAHRTHHVERARSGRAPATWGRKALVPLAIVVLWAVVTETRLVAALFLPSPSDLVESFGDLRAQLLPALASSVGMTLSGFALGAALGVTRSEEHTSELQSRENLVCRLLLEKKKDNSTPRTNTHA